MLNLHQSNRACIRGTMTSQRSTRIRCTLSTRRHQGKRHQSTVKANSSMNQCQERPSIKSDSTGSTKQECNATKKQQHARPANKGTMLDFLKPNSNKTEDNAPTRANTARTWAHTTRKSCETEPHLAQCSKNKQTMHVQGVM